MCNLIAFIAALRYLFVWWLKLLSGYLCFPNTARQPQDNLRHNQNHMRSNTLQDLQPRDEVFFSVACDTYTICHCFGCTKCLIMIATINKTSQTHRKIHLRQDRLALDIAIHIGAK